MSTLVSAHKTQYEEAGYLVVEDLLTQQELQRLHQRTIDIAEGRVEFPPELIELEPGATQRNVETVRKIKRMCRERSRFSGARWEREDSRSRGIPHRTRYQTFRKSDLHETTGWRREAVPSGLCLLLYRADGAGNLLDRAR